VLATMAIILEKEQNIGLRSKVLHCRKYAKSQVIRGKGVNLIHTIQLLPHWKPSPQHVVLLILQLI